MTKSIPRYILVYELNGILVFLYKYLSVVFILFNYFFILFNVIVTFSFTDCLRQSEDVT